MAKLKFQVKFKNANRLVFLDRHGQALEGFIMCLLFTRKVMLYKNYLNKGGRRINFN